jgi:hypothetical protein
MKHIQIIQSLNQISEGSSLKITLMLSMNTVFVMTWVVDVASEAFSR